MPTLKLILKRQILSDDQLEIAEEKLPPSPTTEYDSALIEKDESPDLTNEEDTVSDLVQKKKM